MAEKPYRDAETLRKLYYDQNLTQAEIADRFGVCQPTIANWFDKLGVEAMGSHEKRWERGNEIGSERDGPHSDPEWLREKYWDEKLTLEEIAEEAGVKSEVSILRAMESHGIERRDKSVAFTLSNPGAGFVHADAYGYETIKHSVNNTTKNFKIHRLVAMAHYGIEEVKDCIVHHENGVPWDNRPENLELMTQSEHMKQHVESGDVSLEPRPDAPRDELGRFNG